MGSTSDLSQPADTATMSAQPDLQLYPVDLSASNDGGWATSAYGRTKPSSMEEPWPYRFEVSIKLVALDLIVNLPSEGANRMGSRQCRRKAYRMVSWDRH